MARSGDLAAAIRRAWSPMPPPPAEDLQSVRWACGEEAWRAFAGRAPVAVDLSTPAFLGCTPLFDLPPRAAAAYLGSYLLSLLEGLEFQEENGIFYDALTRAHVLACLSNSDFWEQVIRPHLDPQCRAALADLTSYLASRRDLLGLGEQKLEDMVALSKR